MPAAKFTDAEIREIRQSPRSARDLAKHYNVTHPTILNVLDRRTYKHVPDHVGSGPNNEYAVAHAGTFLRGLPSGYCETVVTSPPVNRRPAFSTYGDVAMPHQDYVGWQRDIIAQCIRVTGPEGIVLYLHRFENSDTRCVLTDGFPLQQIIIWNHQMRGFFPDSRRMTRLPNAYDVIFMFTGPRWAVPDEAVEAVIQWGDVWDIVPRGNDFRMLGGHPSRFPDELADRCVALGRGRVLDPFARNGTTPLAAIRAGRDWLACDIEQHHLIEFKQRLERMETSRRYTF